MAEGDGFVSKFAKVQYLPGQRILQRGSNPVEVLNFSGFYTCNCINCVHNSEDHSLLYFTSAVQYMKYFIYNFTDLFLIIVQADQNQTSIVLRG